MSLRIETNTLHQRRFITTSFAAVMAGVLLLGLYIYILIVPAHALPGDDFVTTWKTDNPGTSNSSSITIPTTGGGYNYDVDWNNDGTFDQFGITGGVTHNFGTPGTYTIRIQGSFPQIQFDYGGDRQKIIDINQWGTRQWRSMAYAFSGTSNLSISATDAPNLSNVTDISYMFYASSVNSNINHWDVSHVTNMTYMFGENTAFNQPLGNWNTSNVTRMGGMFYATSFNQNINTWNVGSVTEMWGMFGENTAFNQPLGNWNTSNVTDMENIFRGATSFNQNINTWNVGSLTKLSGAFENATAFNQPLNNWNTSNVTDMRWVFSGATAFNQPLSLWNTGSVTMMLGMFANATSFNQNINTWNVSNVMYMNSMFYQATSFNQPLNNWDMSNVTDVGGMFRNATSFNQPLGNWDVSGVTSMYLLFQQATSFNQSLGSWNISAVTDLSGALDNTALSRANYDATLTGWSGQSLQSGVQFGVANLQYCTAGSARQSIASNYGWGIYGDSFSCDDDTVDDTVEAQAPNNGDGNADGIPDNQQTNVASIPNEALGSDPYVTMQLASSGNNCESFDYLYQREPDEPDANYEYPTGLTDFSLGCTTPGGTATVTIYYDKLYDTSDWVIRKYNATTNEYNTVSGGTTIGTFNRNGTPVTTLTYTLTDGGAFDDDGLANGTIVDPIGPAISLIGEGSATPGAPNSGTGAVVNMDWLTGIGSVGAILALTTVAATAYRRYTFTHDQA